MFESKLTFRGPGIFKAVVRLCVFTAIVMTPLIPKSAWAIDIGSVQVYGYIDLEYKQTTENKFNFTGPDDPNAKNGSFDQHHFNILMDITISPKLFVKTHVEFEHGINAGVGDASVVLEYGFGEYILSDWLKFRGGKMLTPWGIYNEIHDATPAFLSVFIPEALYRAEDRGGFSMMPKWNTGLAVLGEFSAGEKHSDFDYIVFVGNGESRSIVNENEHDDNRNKAVGGRFQITTHDNLIMAGISAFYGDKAISGAQLDERHFTWIATADVNWHNLNVHSEYGYSQLAQTKENAWYTQASWRFGRFTPYVRYQTTDPDVDIPSDNWTTYLGGLNVRITDALFFKIEWNENRRQRHNADILIDETQNYGEFRSAVAILF